MNWQHRYGAPARPRGNDHTVWEGEGTAFDMPWWAWVLVAFGLVALWVVSL